MFVKSLIGVAAFAAVVSLTAPLFVVPRAVAGPLNPPAGPVTSSYKTLTEVEPRIAINSTNTPGDADSTFRITQSGPYYPTGNITAAAGFNGIENDASNVTPDRMGHRVIGSLGGRNGSFVNGTETKTGRANG